LTPNEWILSEDTGRSSKTIWAVMMEVIKTPQRCNYRYDIPNDPSDFGRCYRLLMHFPEWIKRLNEMSIIFPKWKPLIDNWNELVMLWIKENPSGKCPMLYNRMSELKEECYLADGWIKKSDTSWERNI